jgi:hypothetical protein
LLLLLLHRGAPCNLATQYENPASINRTRECLALTPCKLNYLAVAQPVTLGGNQTTVLKIRVR